MGPKRYDEVEALKAQAVAARTYALAHRGQFETEGYDLCATPKCQVYAGFAAEDPLSNGAVDATRGLVLASGGAFADALFISTCGGQTENVENVFTGEAAPYLVSVDCGELPTMALAGARVRNAPASGPERSRVAGLRARRALGRPPVRPRGVGRDRAALGRDREKGVAARVACAGRGLSVAPAGVRPLGGAGGPRVAARAEVLLRISRGHGAPDRRGARGVRVPPPIPLRRGRGAAASRPQAVRGGVRGAPVLGDRPAPRGHGALGPFPLPGGGERVGANGGGACRAPGRSGPSDRAEGGRPVLRDVALSPCARAIGCAGGSGGARCSQCGWSSTSRDRRSRGSRRGRSG